MNTGLSVRAALGRGAAADEGKRGQPPRTYSRGDSVTRTGDRIIPKYRDESLADYKARVKRTNRLRREQVGKFLKENEPDEPIESLLDACERKWAKGTGQ